MGIKETLARAKSIVLGKETRDLNQMMDDSRKAYIDPEAATHFRVTFEEERDRLGHVIYDHEQHWNETGEYTTGRGDGSIPRTDKI